ncbi:hypothetical protein [Pedobacter cryoconitis]|uniref:YhhN-like protein n=1 Tax=Pedobacter cryoconitis TaxID=188932 RepID=A0A327SUF7_9SPHI|nr:hypothetical protein [Pedobacter cryoconitis]RAJ29247.1 hypothetical protein LY11_02952 [Pedobacter cryoconitis]
MKFSASLIYTGVIVPAGVLIPIVVAYSKRKYTNRPLEIIWYYLLLDGVVNLLAVLLADHEINNLPVLHVFTILEFLLLSYFYLSVLREKAAGRIIKYLLVIFPVFCIVNFLFFQSIYQFNTYARPVEALIIMGCSLAYFAQTNDADTRWSFNPLNWINTGILLYFSGALFIFSFSNLTVKQMSEKYYAINILMWNIHATLLLLMYLLIAFGFSKCRIK